MDIQKLCEDVVRISQPFWIDSPYLIKRLRLLLKEHRWFHEAKLYTYQLFIVNAIVLGKKQTQSKQILFFTFLSFLVLFDRFKLFSLLK